MGSILLAFAAVAGGYHIDNAEDGVADPLGAADFVVMSVPTLLCEVEWGAGTGGPPPLGGASDDAAGGPGIPDRPGIGGLCSSGRNDATGEPAPVGVPFAGTYTRIDACSVTTATRNGGLAGPYLAAGSCAAGGGDTDDHAWTFELGVFTCSVPTTDALAALFGVSANYAAYYDEQYAWWSYAGPSVYTPADPVGQPHSGDGVGGISHNADAFHGHVALHVDAAASLPGFSAVGSAETAPGSAGQSNGVWHLARLPDAFRPGSDCGGSPGFGNPSNASGVPPSGTPVFMACYEADPAGGCYTTAVYPRPVCGETADGGMRFVYSCEAGCPGPWRMHIGVRDGATPSSPPPVPGRTVVGELHCHGGGSWQNTCATSILLGFFAAVSGPDCLYGPVSLGGIDPSCRRNGGSLPYHDPNDSWAVVCVAG